MVDFSEQHLSNLVNQIATESGWLLEIVNYNIAGQQYVCTGNVSSLLKSNSPDSTNAYHRFEP